MKTPASHREIAERGVRTFSNPTHAGRENLPLYPLPDCLLAAYDGVARRAFERFKARGSNAGSEIADWRAAENDLFLPVAVDIEDTEKVLYALAAVEGLTGSQISVAIEDRWLLISGHPAQATEGDGDIQEESRYARTQGIEWDELHRILQRSEASDSSESVPGEMATEPANRVRPRPFCVLELPVMVDVARSIAVLSDGLIAIRMPKANEQTGTSD